MRNSIPVGSNYDVLVTGACGFVGSVFVPMVLDEHPLARIVAVDSMWQHQPPPWMWKSNRVYSRQVRLVKMDISTETERFADLVKRSGIVVHLAGLVGAPACAADPERAHAWNVEPARVLAGADARVVNASTGSVYGSIDGVCTEDTPCEPLSVYGETKLQAERELRGAVHLRFATGYGCSPKMRLDVLPNDFSWQAISEGNLVIYQPGARRTFIHVYDMARALYHAMQKFDELQGNAYNVGSPDGNMTKMQLAELVAKHAPMNIFEGEGSDPDQRDYEVDYSKFTDTGWSAWWTMNAGISAMVEALRMLRIRRPYRNGD